MIKQILKYLIFAGFLISFNLQASTDFFQEPGPQRCLNFVRMTDVNQLPAHRLLTLMSLGMGIAAPVLEALEKTGLPLHQPHHEDVVAFLMGIKAHQLANQLQDMDLSLPENINLCLNQLARNFNVSKPFAINFSLKDLTTIPSLLPCLKKLRKLELDNTQLTDISAIASLTCIEKLYLDVNQIRDLRPLESLKELIRLGLGFNQISDVSPLASLTKLKTLYLTNNELTDISPLGSLICIEEIYLAENKITDVSALESLTKLKALYLTGNPAVNEQNFERTIALFLPTVYISMGSHTVAYGTRGVSVISQE